MLESSRVLRGINMKTLKIVSLIFVTLLFANCSSVETNSQRSIATDSTSEICNSKADIKGCLWSFCYNDSENRVYFIPQDVVTVCKSKTFYKGPKDFLMTDSGITDDGFTTGGPGTPFQQKRRDGSRVFISSWNNLESYNHIIVIEPDFRTNTTKKLCQLKNYSATFSSRQNKATGLIEILIREPISDESNNFHRVWKPCNN